MTEAEWLECGNPNAILRKSRTNRCVNYRKATLCAVNLFRRQMECFPHTQVQSVADASEAFAAGVDNYRWLHQLWQEAERAARRAQKQFSTFTEGWEFDTYHFVADVLSTATPNISSDLRSERATKALHRIIRVMWRAAGDGKTGVSRRHAERREGHTLALHLRDIFGNPFRPVSFDPAWRTDTAVSLARGMYDSRELVAMPILADALQDAGCEDEQVLNHCRDANQPHVRGCWVCDLVLGKV
jgi:hypothetical protein